MNSTYKQHFKHNTNHGGAAGKSAIYKPIVDVLMEYAGRKLLNAAGSTFVEDRRKHHLSQSKSQATKKRRISENADAACTTSSDLPTWETLIALDLVSIEKADDDDIVEEAQFAFELNVNELNDDVYADLRMPGCINLQHSQSFSFGCFKSFSLTKSMARCLSNNCCFGRPLRHVRSICHSDFVCGLWWMLQKTG